MNKPSQDEKHVPRVIGWGTDNGDGPQQVWQCSCSFTGYLRDMDKHMRVPKTMTDALRELHTALVELRTAIIESLPGVIRKAFKQWDSERTK